MAIPLMVLQSEDKSMPLDLSCSRGIDCSSNVDEDDDDKDDIIVTLTVPGRQGNRHHHCSEPIVIPSDSEDSDEDVTVVSDFSTLNNLPVSHVKKSSSFGKVLGVPIAGPSDDTDDDCFVSFSSNIDVIAKTGITSVSRGVPHAGIKRIFEDSSSQSSVDSPPSPLGNSFVQGKDAFLSDASSLSSAEDLRMILASTDSLDKNLVAASSPAKASLPSTGSLDLINSLRKSFSLDHSTTVDLAQVASSNKLLSSIGTTSISSDFVSDSNSPSKAVAIVPTSSSHSTFSYGISQLLAVPQTGVSSLNVPALQAVPCPAGTVPVTDLSSLFCVPSFDNLYPDSAPTSSSAMIISSQQSLTTAKKTTSNASCVSTDSDIVVLSPPSRTVSTRTRRGSIVVSSTAAANESSSVSRSLTSTSSGTMPDKEWTIQSKGDCKVLLRRSMSHTVSSSSSTSSDVPVILSGTASKRRRISAAAAVTATTSDDSVSDASVTMLVSLETAMCYGCRKQISSCQLSYCMAGHGCCGQCLQSQVKTLLASGKKGTLKCRYTSCMSFYLVSQLHNSLPSMVVEILEEKLDREYCDNAAKLMLKAIGKGLIGAFSDDDFDDRDVDHSGTLSSVKDEDTNIFDIPKTWEPMTSKEEYRLVELVRGGSDEYTWVAALFHQSMTRPRAQIVTIKRVQNQILWQFYMVKKKQMERDSNRPVVEKNLFHGTCRNVVDSICRNNFDWRLCGAHGTMYGQGSYFALDAAYSHMYTDQPPSRASHHHGAPGAAATSSAIFSGAPPPSHHQLAGPAPGGSVASATSAAAQMLFQAFPGSSHAVSIAALHSCRFAHLPGGTLLPTGPSGYVPAMPAYFLGPSSSTTSHVPPSTASPASPHVHCMFLARVLVGDYMTGKSLYRKPPPVDPSQPYGRCYDSCVNDLNNPTIFVIFNNSQCYPEYIVEYTNKARE